MLRLLADEDFNGRIVRGLFLQRRDLDLVRVQDVGLQGADDEAILEWAEHHRRILLTHDARTIPRHARNRLADGLHFPGAAIVDDQAPIGVCSVTSGVFGNSTSCQSQKRLQRFLGSLLAIVERSIPKRFVTRQKPTR